jgi:hypothetical protein
VSALARINRNLMIPHFRRQSLPIGIGKEHARLLQRDVAVDAAVNNLIADLRILATLFRLMATEAAR